MRDWANQRIRESHQPVAPATIMHLCVCLLLLFSPHCVCARASKIQAFYLSGRRRWFFVWAAHSTGCEDGCRSVFFGFLFIFSPRYFGNHERWIIIIMRFFSFSLYLSSISCVSAGFVLRGHHHRHAPLPSSSSWSWCDDRPPALGARNNLYAGRGGGDSDAEQHSTNSCCSRPCMYHRNELKKSQDEAEARCNATVWCGASVQ